LGPWGVAARSTESAASSLRDESANAYNDGTDKGTLAYRDLTGLADGFADILRGALRPGGHVVVPARPWRKNGQLVDLPSAVIGAGLRAGLIPTERCVAPLSAVRSGRLIARPSFFRLTAVRMARIAGTPLHLIAHEDVLIFAKPACRFRRCGGRMT
jgi:hypothetical protein